MGGLYVREKRLKELEAEVERLRQNLDNIENHFLDVSRENERLRANFDCAECMQPEVDELKRRVTRLRKVVNWLRGANHENALYGPDSHDHGDDVKTCTQWECQRARAVLEEK